MRGIDTFIFDFDGVLSPVLKTIGPEGRRISAEVNSRDCTAIKWLIEEGYDVVIVTASDWEGIHNLYRRYGCRVLSTQNKKEVFDEFNIRPENCCGVGDSMQDAEMLALCSQAFTTLDGSPLLSRHIKRLRTKGGEGVVSEIIFRLRRETEPEHNFEWNKDIA